MNKLRESLADLQHEIWANFLKHLFDICYPIDDGSMWVPAEKVKCWKKQVETPYYELSEEEKDKDREIADKVLELL